MGGPTRFLAAKEGWGSTEKKSDPSNTLDAGGSDAGGGSRWFEQKEEVQKPGGEGKKWRREKVNRSPVRIWGVG